MFTFFIVILVLISSFIMARVEGWLNLPEQMQHIWGNKRAANPPLFDRFCFFTTLITLGISTSISTINKMNRDSKERLNLEKEKISTELSFLKTQIHPHFFFNTLNTIYALSFTDAETSRKILTKLSSMMRYLLYETEQNVSTLSKELSFIQNYVEIMKLRLNNNTLVEFQLPNETLPMSIAPMILMPYIENVFKHGIDDKKGGTLFISIEQSTKGIRLNTRNKIVPAAMVIESVGSSKGIGMQNTLRRLELLYKGRYRLFTTTLTDSNEFELNLELDLQ